MAGRLRIDFKPWPKTDSSTNGTFIQVDYMSIDSKNF